MKKYLLFLILLIPIFNVNAYTFGNGTSITLPNNVNEYFVVSRGSLNLDYVVVSSSSPFYFICNRHGSNDSTCVTRNYKISVSEQVFNDSQDAKYYDELENKYYIFTGSDNFIKWGSYDDGVTWSEYANYRLYSYLSSPNVDAYFYDLDNVLDDYNKHIVPPYNVNGYVVTFHLNGGTAFISNSNGSGSSGGGHGSGFFIHYEDYTVNFYDKIDLYSYLSSLTIKNDLVTFNQWYYDEQLTQPYNSNNEINSNIDLYASYEYTSVDSIINNINFNEYTFNSPNDDYEYAVISVKENFSQGMYIGLGFNFQYLDAYKYIISDNAFIEKSFISLNSIGSINNKYYYHLGGLDNDSSIVVVLDKANLIKLGVNDEIEHYYDFWVSDNCYVYFTNDLTQISYYIPINNGSSSQLLQNKDISLNYDYTQKFILDSNTDIITKFIFLIRNGDFSIFNFFKNLWAKIRAYKILNYFMIISLGGIIVALIKGGSRH